MLHQSQFIEMFGTPDNHPAEYAVKNLGELSECYAGATPSTKVKEYWENGSISWMSSGEVHMGHVTETESKITESGYKHASTKMVPVHSVVIALAGQGKTRGTVAITEIPLCTNQSLCAIVPSKDIHYEYLYHNLKGRYLELRGMAGDVNGRGGLNLKIVQSIRVIVPPLSEQMRFVGIAQQADKSKFDGFKSQFISQFGNDSILKVELSSLCTEFLDGDWIESKDQSDSGYRLVQTGNVGVGEYIDKSGKARFVSEDTFIRLNCTEIFAGDILFSRLPEPLGRCCILPENFPKAITAVDCTIARLGDRCLPEFLVTYTSTELYTSQVNKCMTGTTRQRISRNNLAKILVPCPDLAAQNSFVMVARQADKSKYLN